MTKKQLQQNLYEKIHTEYLSYQKEICAMAPDAVFEKAEEISAMREIYGNLLHSIPEMDTSQLEGLLCRQGLLGTFYQEWNRIEISIGEETSRLVEEFLEAKKKEGRMAG